VGPGMSAILEEFQAEAAEHLDKLTSELLKLERDPAALEPVRAMFLSAHTIKGSAAMLDLQLVREIAHAMEEVLVYLRDARQPLDAKTADLVFKALDKIRELIQNPVAGVPVADAEISQLCAALRSYAVKPATQSDQRARTTTGPDVSGGAGVSPALRREAGAQQATASSVPATAGDTSVRPRALLVEDSATVRLLETMQLEDAGYAVEAVSSHEEVLARVPSHAYALIVTGIGQDDDQVCHLAAKLREAMPGSGIPIIVMTREQPAERQPGALPAGARVCVRKGTYGEKHLTETAHALLAAGDRAAKKR